MKTKLCKWGNSQGIRIPKKVLTALNISEDANLELSYDTETKTITLRAPYATPYQQLVQHHALEECVPFRWDTLLEEMPHEPTPTE